jgi:zinc transport system permease protein
MLDSLATLFAYDFVRRALIAGILVGGVCSALSTYVVVKRMAFIGVGISHSALGGIGFALWLLQYSTKPDTGIYLITTAYCVLVALLIGLTTRKGRISEDSAIGIFFAISMAIGIIFIFLRRTYSIDIFSYLFGNILAVTRDDVYVITALAAIVIAIIILFYKELFYFSFDEEMATVSGLPVEFLRSTLLTILSLTIVIASKVIGIILLSAFLIIPGATASLVTRNFHRMMLVAVAIGIGSSIVGLVLSSSLNLPSGATIVITQFALFLLASLMPHRA